MRITLTRTGGIIPITKKAEQEVDWSKEEMNELLSHIQVKTGEPGQARDATAFQLKHDAGTVAIDLEKIPAKFKKAFECLKENLKIVRE